MARKKKTKIITELEKPKEIEEPKEKMVSFYDPVADAFREIPLSLAIKFLQSAYDLEERLIKEGEIEIEEE